jgi:hypothetical protein
MYIHLYTYINIHICTYINFIADLFKNNPNNDCNVMNNKRDNDNNIDYENNKDSLVFVI